MTYVFKSNGGGEEFPPASLQCLPSSAISQPPFISPGLQFSLVWKKLEIHQLLTGKGVTLTEGSDFFSSLSHPPLHFSFLGLIRLPGWRLSYFSKANP